MNIKQKTNAMRFLDKNQINYNIYKYDIHDNLNDGISVAYKIGKDVSSVLKRL